MPSAIAVYAHWDGIQKPLRLGFLHSDPGARRELFSFEFDQAVLSRPDLQHPLLDPRIGLHAGRQFPTVQHPTFGVFSDASPDRWGRLLIHRRHERQARAGMTSLPRTLRESDYLLGVHDSFRLGGLRFRPDDHGAFADAGDHVPAPSFVRLRELEAASAAIERDEDNSDPAGDEWLRMLIAPGGSLGGARPKASVQDPLGGLWIAKFPSRRDTRDVGAWELVTQTLARSCGIRTPPGRVQRCAHAHHTFLTKRFDRLDTGERIHFASAMTLTGHVDGDDAASGASYLELVDVISRYGTHTAEDLRELWLRIVFNICVSNADDHLRNHGFLLTPGRGWRLSEAYDMNPEPGARELKLNISEVDNAMSLDLARFVAPHFRLGKKDADGVIEHVRATVRKWEVIAESLKIPEKQRRAMAPAFRLSVE